MPRQRKDFKRKSKHRDPRKFFIIATEGLTEEQYFAALKPLIRSKVFVEVVERSSTASSPSHIIDMLDGYRSEYVLVEGDELWLVIDRDSRSWTTKTIKDIARKCHQKPNYHLALSNPCFEFWLLLHLKDMDEYDDETCKELFDNLRVSAKRNRLEHELKSLLGSYKKHYLNKEAFLPNIQIAIERAKKLDTSPDSRWIDHLGTRVYRLIEKLI